MGSTSEYFDDFWAKKGGDLAADDFYAEKMRIMAEMIPDDVETILDVGCGEGSIVNFLSQTYETTGLDRSIEGLKFLNGRVAGVQGSAEDLPFEDNAFDLVISSEVLEHLPNAIYEAAISEMKRVARKYLLVSVPNREKLRKRFTRCGSCRKEYHIYGHLRRFSLNDVEKIFRPWRLRRDEICGVPDGPTFDAISLVRNKLAQSYFYVDSVDLLCPHCGNVLARPRVPIVQKAIDKLLRYAQAFIFMSLAIKAAPDWLLTLFEEQSVERNTHL